MKNIARLVKHELQEAIFPTIFFLVVFHIVAVSKTLTLETYDVTSTGAGVATIGALVVAKVILIADRFSFANLFSEKPLVFSVLWKTIVFGVLVFLFRVLEELVPLLSKSTGVETGFGYLIEEISWPHFWALQLWLVVALVAYNAIMELDKHLGAGSLRKAFIGT